MILSILAAAAACVASVHDGDSIRLCDGEKVRIANIDAPELPGSSRCDPRQLRGGRNPSWCDHALAARSRDELAGFLATGTVEVHRQGYDRYGRTLARVTVNGRDAGAHLIRQGLARPWR